MSDTRRDPRNSWRYPGRDQKPWWKPPFWYKLMLKQLRKARGRQAMREGKDPERERRGDMWGWT